MQDCAYIYTVYYISIDYIHRPTDQQPLSSKSSLTKTKEWDQMLSTLRQLYVRLLDGPLQVNTDAAENKAPADDSFKKVPKGLEVVEMMEVLKR